MDCRGARVVVANRMPVEVRDRPIGAVVTLRDRTELEKLLRELDDVRRTRGLHREARRRVPYPVVALVGRAKELISRGGNKISPLEIEAAFAAHPAVGEVLATVVPEEQRSATLNLVYLPLYAAGISGPAACAITGIANSIHANTRCFISSDSCRMPERYMHRDFFHPPRAARG